MFWYTKGTKIPLTEKTRFAVRLVNFSNCLKPAAMAESIQDFERKAFTD